MLTSNAVLHGLGFDFDDGCLSSASAGMLYSDSPKCCCASDFCFDSVKNFEMCIDFFLSIDYNKNTYMILFAMRFWVKI